MSIIHIYPDEFTEFDGQRYPHVLGESGPTHAKDEGDGATPTGEFRLRKVYHRPDRRPQVDTILPTEPITPELGWGDDPADPDNYNQPVSLPYLHSHERMWRDDHLYDIVVDLDYNREQPEPGKGSAIFLHLSRDQEQPSATPTRGCIAFRAADLETILRGVTPDTIVRIYPPTENETT
jgi:L,D-peptidoglycan transpeptidase YkuD (ErfK/YbiS/YcfS/YnhG family)